ncbi:MAG: PTS sugar transporter subunit IIB [Mycoplasmataceae bacterium]|nr:PTS sugar transporter subunit IIB [Mycoplasmataceae bacterium]
MPKILLLCSAGMSTSMLVKKMKEDARTNGWDWYIEAKGMGESKGELNNWDLIMLGPQVSYALNDVKSLTSKPVVIIPGAVYAIAKGSEANAIVKKTLNI